MHRPALALLATTVVAGLGSGAAPDPKSLEVPANELDKARGLVRQLGNDSYRDREIAAGELRKMGRTALPAIAEAASSSEDNEVRLRCELLLPAIETADLNAKIAAFLSDKDGKFEHDLPGWKELRSVTDGGPMSRALFADMVRSPDVRQVLAGLGKGQDEFARRAGERKTKLGQQLYPQFIGVGQPQVYTPTAPDFASILLADAVLGKKANNNVNNLGNTANFLYHHAFRSILDNDKYGPVMKQLLVGWCDAQSDANGVMTAMNVAMNLNMKEAARYAEKAMEVQNPNVWTKAQALGVLARFGGKEKLPAIEKHFDDKTQIQVGGRGQEQLQLRDAALAMAALAAGKSPADYGFTVQNAFVNGQDAVKFNFWLYRFPSDEARTKAFEKWKTDAAKK